MKKILFYCFFIVLLIFAGTSQTKENKRINVKKAEKDSTFLQKTGGIPPLNF